MFLPLRRPTRGLVAGIALGALAVSSLALGGASVALAAGGSSSATSTTSEQGTSNTSASAARTAASTAAPSPTASADAAATATGDRSSFLLPVIPDTQFYSRYSAAQFVPQYGTNPFEVQTQWIVDHKKELNIPFAAQLGDVVDQQWVGDQWTAASKAMKILEDGGVPYSILPGNHDVADQGARSSEGNASAYLSNFPASTLQREAGKTFLGAYQNGYSSAYKFAAEGHDWIMLSIGWNASDDTFSWAQQVLDANPGVPVVLTSHAIIGIKQDQVSPDSWWYGDLLWDRLIRKNDQIVVTLNGHFHGATTRTLTNDFGHPVHEILTDYQMAADGGNGIMTLLEFDLSHGRIDVATVSPWVPKKHANSLTSTDAPVLTGTWQDFSLNLDFAQRFGWAAPSAKDVDDVDLSERAKAIVSQGWTGTGHGEQLAAAGDATDYEKAPGTIAHWRFGGVPEGVVDDKTVIPDIAGSSPMYRNPIDQTDAPEKLEDLTVTHSNVPFYSADKGAACFQDVHRNSSGPDNLSYITTEYGAPATSAHLTADSGYTLETFLQMDANWTEAANRWSAAITRGGARQWIGINDSSDAGAGAAWLGISNLREYQFSAADTASKNSYTLWSGEIMPGSWHHVAIVNDPATKTVIMYVDGVPVLRNASSVGGMMAADLMPWIIGASTWNTEPEHGWFGCVGETRIVDHALSADQFLFQRPNIDATGTNFALTTDVSGVLASTATVPAFSGTGLPGATVRVQVDGAAAESATVAADGSWTIPLSHPVAGVGAHAVSFVQSVGTRDGKPLATTVTIGVDGAWSPSESGLDPAKEGAITVTPGTFRAGDSVSVTVPAAEEGAQLYGFLFSTPAAMGTAVASGNSVALTAPANAQAGAHRVAVYTSTGTLVGWSAVTVAPAPAGGGTGTDSGAGTDGGGAGAPGTGSGVTSAPIAAGASPQGDKLAATGLASGMLGILALGGLAVSAVGFVLLRNRRRSA